ncbi:MAG: GGDEF domain-containing protein [Gammaproteobacteria bacterium]|jgi:diguanylate cyclase (GGDEF)-like protein
MKNILETSHQPDARLLRRLRRAERVCLLLASLIAIFILIGWLLPPLQAILPDGWPQMKANTALAVLLCAVGFALERQTRTHGQTIARKICASIVVLLTGAALYEHATGDASGIGTLLATDEESPMPGLMPEQAAVGLLLIGAALLLDSNQKMLLGYLLDFVVSVTFVLLMIMVAGSVYNVTLPVGKSDMIPIAPQTLACFAMLAFVLISRRAPRGIFSPMVSIGIGGQIARILIPSSIAVTYLLILAGLSVAILGRLSMSLSAALTAASIVVILFFSTLLVARRINALESRLRASSLTDELTGLHNFRGLTLMGERLLLDARRGEQSLSMIFIDADGLKEVNDTLGHDAGSRMLVDIATLLRGNFRDVDLIGRVGGDEFAVMVKGDKSDLESMLERFKAAIEEANRLGDKPYRISCSLGVITTEPNQKMSLIDLLAHADAKMYENKRERRARNSSRSATEAAG